MKEVTMDLTSLITGAITGGAADKIGKATGADQDTVQTVIQAGLPVILGQLANNTSTPEGTQQLDTAVSKDHSGGTLLDSLGSLFGGGDSNPDGNKILGHVFGDNQSAATSTIAKTTGVDSATVVKILSFLAPLVMAYLGKQKSTDNLDAGGLSTVLQQQKSPSGGALSQIATAVLDKNSDGNIVDDILGGFFKR